MPSSKITVEIDSLWCKKSIDKIRAEQGYDPLLFLSVSQSKSFLWKREVERVRKRKEDRERQRGRDSAKEKGRQREAER